MAVSLRALRAWCSCLAKRFSYLRVRCCLRSSHTDKRIGVFVTWFITSEAGLQWYVASSLFVALSYFPAKQNTAHSPSGCQPPDKKAQGFSLMKHLCHAIETSMQPSWSFYCLETTAAMAAPSPEPPQSKTVSTLPASSPRSSRKALSIHALTPGIFS